VVQVNDAIGGIVPILIELPPGDIALVKFLFESYEGVAVIRTIDRRRALIVALVSRDFIDVARGILDGLRDSVKFHEVAAPEPAPANWPMNYLVDSDGDGDAGPSAAS